MKKVLLTQKEEEVNWVGSVAMCLLENNIN